MESSNNIRSNSHSSTESGHDNLACSVIDESEMPAYNFAQRRRSDAFSFSNPIYDNPYDLSTNHQDANANLHSQEMLITTQLQLIQPRDFRNEIRSMRDVQLFLNNPCIILDCPLTNLEEIIDCMLKKVLNNVNKSQSSERLEEIKRLLFAGESCQLFSNWIQGIYVSPEGEYSYDQSWICAFCSLASLSERRVAISRLNCPTNMGISAHDIQFVMLVLAPVQEKKSKSASEASRTLATLFADVTFRRELLSADNEPQFANILTKRAETLTLKAKSITKQELSFQIEENIHKKEKTTWRISFGKGLIENVTRRAKFYVSDFIDGFVGDRTARKTLATIVFLYFTIILPTIAFGVLDDKNTQGGIDTHKALIGQAIGGLLFAFLAGQPLVIIATTAPLCLYTKVVFDIANDMGVDFFAMFACVGLWNAFFTILYALFDVSIIMKFCTRSTEEIFATFIFFAFSIDAIRECAANFQQYYCVGTINPELSNSSITTTQPVNTMLHLWDSNSTSYKTLRHITSNEGLECAQEKSVLFVLLMLATAWLAVVLRRFNSKPYFNLTIREILADYALPIAVICLSFVGTFLFADIDVPKFKFSEKIELHLAPMSELTVGAVFVSAGLGFPLSLLFFMDQNISSALVNNPNNNLKKGNGYHLDLLIVGLLNGILSLFGLPWMHGILPHSPLHARCLADVEQRTEEGHIKEVVVRIRETRVTGILAHILIALSLLLIPHPLDYIPISVLNGLFLFLALGTLEGNSFWERILLFFTEQTAYPPNHYIRRCPQRKIHTFTITQLIQLAVLCFFGFAPWAYVQMAFPLIIAIFIPIRWFLVPKIIEKKYLDAIDGYH